MIFNEEWDYSLKTGGVIVMQSCSDKKNRYGG